MTAAVAAQNLAFAYDGVPVLGGVDLSVERGELVGLVGPNGAGKTTLLHTLLGLIRADSGEVLLDGARLDGLSRMAVARRAALVPQSAPSDFAFTVREAVAMGRTPHLGWFRPEGPEDQRAVDEALAATGSDGLADRLVSELSGGERQRVHIARALAQQTPLILLDEPTANLDVEHQLSILELLRSLVGAGRAAIVALHDLSLAARYCDRVLLLAERRIVAGGAPAEVITVENLARYFRIRARIERHPGDGALVVVPVSPIEPGALTGGLESS